MKRSVSELANTMLLVYYVINFSNMHCIFEWVLHFKAKVPFLFCFSN